MKLWGIFRFELTYQVRRPWTWLIGATLIVLSFLVSRDTSVEAALYEDLIANSPFGIAKTTVVCGLFWLLAAAFLTGDAASRDIATRMHPLTWTMPLRKRDYLGGRFLAAFVLNAGLLLAVQGGIIFGIYATGMEARVLGPFRPAAFLTAYALIALPNAFAATAIQFWLALRTGRAMVAYIGSLFLVFLGFFVGTLLNFLVKQGLGTLVDPIGIQLVVEDLAHLWTTVEKNTRLLALEGPLLTNRVVWIGVALAVLTLTYARFRFEHRVAKSWWKRRRVMPQAETPQQTALHIETRQTFDFATRARQALAIGWTSFRWLAASWPGRALLVGIPMLTVLVIVQQMSLMGTPLVPTTIKVVSEMTGGLSAELAAAPSRWMIIPLLIIFFAGELIWRERDAGVGEITDSMPLPEWVPLLGKFLGLAFVLAAFMAVQTVAGMVAQTILGYHHFELALYLQTLFGLQLPEYLLFAVLALVVHVVVNQKYAGHLVAVLAYGFTAALAAMLGIEHNLLVYGRGPGWMYTPMRGFGGSIAPWLWFKLYWAAWALLLAVAARLLWVRGREGGLAVRLRLARRRFAGATVLIAGAAAMLILVLGGFIFYNTNIVNEYINSDGVKQRRADYERRYRRYESLAQPALTKAKLRVELYPKKREAQIRGTYTLVNRSAGAIGEIHLSAPKSGIEPRAVAFDRTAKPVLRDSKLGYRIYQLEKPLLPGETLRLYFEVALEPHGFTNHGAGGPVVANGTFFNNVTWFPAVGYQRSLELLSAADRREHGLTPRPLLESLSDDDEGEVDTRGGAVAFQAVLGTDEEQTAVAPGELRRTWTEGRRRYFEYVTSAPIGTEWAFFSARYAMRETRWGDVTIRVFHDPRHTAHLDRVLRSVRASFDYHEAHYIHYPYRHLTIVERGGGPGAGMHADASMIYHGEHFPFWIPEDEQRGFDMPYAVVAHEMGHQWTIPYALREGIGFMAEGLAQFTAMQVVNASRGEEQAHRLIAFMRQPYPYRPIRRGEPLLRAIDPYLSRRRGPFAMWAMREYVSEEAVNTALRRMIEKHEQPGARGATTLDLYRELQGVTPPSLHYLLHDLFEVNTFWNFDTRQATAKRIAGGMWQVTLEIEARKVVYDEAGRDRVVPMDELIEIGVFAPAENGRFALSAPLYLQKQRIRSGRQTITVTVPSQPRLAGIDPYHVLDWDESGESNNVRRVSGGAR